MKQKSKALNTVINVLLWIIIAIAALFTIFTLATKDETNVSSIGGYMPMTVMSNSMVPEFEKGDLILDKKVEDTSTLEEGDVVSFYTVIEGQTVINTHRIVEVIDSDGLVQYVTKGDANELVDDRLITGNDIVGQYVKKVPFLGKLFNVLSSKIGFLIVIVLPLLLFFLYQAYKLVLLLVEMKKQAVVEANNASREQIEAEIRAKLEEEARIKKDE